MKVFDIELTIEEIEIIRLALTNNMGTSFALAYYAKERGKDANAVLEMAQNLYKKFDDIVTNNNPLNK